MGIKYPFYWDDSTTAGFSPPGSTFSFLATTSYYYADPRAFPWLSLVLSFISNWDVVFSTRWRFLLRPRASGLTSHTKFDYVTLACLVIGIKYRPRHLDTKTLLWQTQLPWLEGRFPRRFRESRRYCHWYPFETSSTQSDQASLGNICDLTSGHNPIPVSEIRRVDARVSVAMWDRRLRCWLTFGLLGCGMHLSLSPLWLLVSLSRAFSSARCLRCWGAGCISGKRRCWLAEIASIAFRWHLSWSAGSLTGERPCGYLWSRG